MTKSNNNTQVKDLTAMSDIELSKFYDNSDKPFCVLAIEYGVTENWLWQKVIDGDMERDEIRGVEAHELTKDAFETYPEPSFN